MSKAENYLFLKILLLALFLLLLNSWMTYHIGQDFMETYFVNGVLVFSGLVSFLVQYLRKGQEEKINKIYSRWLYSVLNFQVIGGLYILFFMVGCFVSSVHISTNKAQSQTVINLSAPHDSTDISTRLEISENNLSVSKTLLTIPFGRTFVLDTKGYQKLQFQVYPWIGKRIDLENDLQISPSVIMRVPAEKLTLLSRLKLRVQRNKETAVTYDLKNHATIILGQLDEIPPTYFEKWLSELRGKYEEDLTGSFIYSVRSSALRQP